MATRSQVADALEPAAPNGGKSTPVAVVVRQAIEQQSASFAQVLPRHVDPDRFARLVLTACKATPALMKCFATEQGKTSVLVAAMQAAALGLEPNTLAEEAWLLPSDNTGYDGVKRTEARLQIGYKGYLKLARESDLVSKIVARVVYENDHFDYEYGIDERLVHKPAMTGERGEPAYVYAIAWYTNGAPPVFVVLDRDDVHARRAMSKSWKSTNSRQYSPWSTNTESMWEKSGIRKLAHWLPRTPRMDAAIASDDADLMFDPDSGDIVPSTPVLEAAEADVDVPDIDVPDDDAADDGTTPERDVINEHNAYDLIDLAKLHGLIPDNASAGSARKALMTIAKDATNRDDWGADADAMATDVGGVVAAHIRSKGDQ